MRSCHNNVMNTIVPMTFTEALLASNYIYDSQVGSWMKEDSNGDLHTYMHIENNDWIYEKYNSNDDVIKTVPFVLT